MQGDFPVMGFTAALVLDRLFPRARLEFGSTYVEFGSTHGLRRLSKLSFV